MIAGVGLALRGWAAGTIQKNEALTIVGPYAYTRNPLYLGSFLIGLGVTLTSGGWLWPGLFVGLFVVLYSRAIGIEDARLEELFGDAFRVYRSHVPRLLPRLTPHRLDDPGDKGFSWARYRRNREWEAALGFVAAAVLLTAKWWWTATA
ncbi:MAG: isoprenylcysteine carboxylmethyltransferase family protein [Gemmatimonadota bacterium]